MDFEKDPLFIQFSEEFKKFEEVPFTLETTALHAWIIACQLQLALKHPENKGPSAEMARELAQKIFNKIGEGNPVLRQVAEMGWGND